MKRFKVIVPIKGIETYCVEAETEDEALRLVKSGDTNYLGIEQSIEETFYEDAEVIKE